MKKVLSTVLAAAMVLGMGAVAFGAKATKDSVSLGESKTGATDWVLDGENAKEVFFTIFNGTDKMEKAQIRSDKIGVQIRASEGSAVIDSAKIVYNKNADGTNKEYAQVKFALKDKYVTTKDIDFAAKLFLTVDKSRASDSEVSITGTFKNAIINVAEGDDYVNLIDTPVVEADDYIKNIEVDLGQGVSIFTRMFEGKKYYGAVSQEIKAEDEAVFNKYPDIATVYKLDTIGLNNTGDTVKFDVDENMYIYVQDEDGNLVFLGRTNDRVPYFTKYFLSSKELDVETEVAPEEPEVEEPETDGPTEEPETDGETGGDDVPENVNDNPGTGR